MRTTSFVLMALVLVGCSRPMPAVTVNPAAAGEALPVLQSGHSQDGTARETEEFRFTEDRGGRLLAALLPPSQEDGRLPADRPIDRVVFAKSRFLEQTEVGVPPNMAEPPLAARGKTTQQMLPHAPTEGLPLAGHYGGPALPEVTLLAVGERTREWTPNISEPESLPILAQKQADSSVSADDATADLSLRAALARAPPQRAAPAPYIRVSLPDPFEHRRTVQLQKEPAESPMPIAGPVRPPQP